MGTYKYAATYWHCQQEYVRFSDDLTDLVAIVEAMGDAGEIGSRSYFVAAASGWLEVDASAEVRAYEQRQDDYWDGVAAKRAERRWVVRIFGPGGTWDDLGRYATQAEADEAAAALPDHVRPEVRLGS